MTEAFLQQQVREGEVRETYIACPWCAAPGPVAGDVHWQQGDTAELDCETCGKPYELTRVVSVDYVTRRPWGAE